MPALKSHNWVPRQPMKVATRFQEILGFQVQHVMARTVQAKDLSLASKMDNETTNTSIQMISEETIDVEIYVAAFVGDFVMMQQYPYASHHPYLNKLLLVDNVAVILTDILAFLAVIRQVWGLWKERRRLSLHTLLLQQVAQLVISYISPVVGNGVVAFQNVLSVILICEFTLDLRRRNTTARSLPNQSDLELPDLNLSFQHTPEVISIQSVLGRLQESIIADMGERNDPVSMGIDAPDQREPDLETA
ncbi:hypothetical protein Clacol_004595 [Clathrus columnatus]|uniref:Uncharacterized protein n=1 Tax=Clathrus columnatus TaxID=1419009 RepID=A0AAV5AAX0_9AGAM|nr:hypothetical protein Clacol_004595 [Clathrus columnatus]